MQIINVIECASTPRCNSLRPTTKAIEIFIYIHLCMWNKNKRTDMKDLCKLYEFDILTHALPHNAHIIYTRVLKQFVMFWILNIFLFTPKTHYTIWCGNNKRFTTPTFLRLSLFKKLDTRGAYIYICVQVCVYCRAKGDLATTAIIAWT